jgi:hypothetical protein
MERDQVDPERRGGELARGGDLLREPLGGHGARRDHTEAAGVRNRCDEMALGYPRHCAAKDRDFGAEKIAAAPPQPVELGAGGRACHAASSP